MDSPPQMRRGGALSAGVVRTRKLRAGVDHNGSNEFFRSL